MEMPLVFCIQYLMSNVRVHHIHTRVHGVVQFAGGNRKERQEERKNWEHEVCVRSALPESAEWVPGSGDSKSFSLIDPICVCLCVCI